MRVRIAQRGIARGSGRAEHVDDVMAGVKLPWVELDGHRFADIVSARFDADDESISSLQLVLDVIGPIELVYTDANGEPLPGSPIRVADPVALGLLDYETVINREDVEGTQEP